MQPGDLVPLGFEPGLMALSFVVAALGSYVALIAAHRIRTIDNRVCKRYVVIAAVALGGVGIWGMHFIGTIAQIFPFEVGYSLPSTVISLMVAIVFSGAALWYVGSAKFSMRRCIVAGVVAGLGVAGMHYLGMRSMRMDAIFMWNVPLVITSVVIAAAAATVSLWMAFNLHKELHRAAAAVVMAVAVCGMHYTGAAAGIIVCTAPRVFGGWQLDGGLLPYVVFLISVVTLVVLRVELFRSSRDDQLNMVRKLEKVLSTR